MNLDIFDRVVVMNVDTRREHGVDAARLVQDHGARDVRIFINGRGCPEMDPSTYGMIHAGQPPETFGFSRSQWDYGNAYHAVVKQALQDEVGSLLILEDDITIAGNFDAIVARAVVPEDWQLVYYGAMHFWASKPAEAVPGHPYIRRLNGGQVGSQAIGWRPEAMARYLDQPNDLPGDSVIARLHQVVPSYCIHPAVIRQAAGVSSVVKEGEPFTEDFVYEIRE